MFQKPVWLHADKTSLGQQSATIPWLTSDFADLGVSPVLPPKSLNLVQPWFDSFGNTFMVKFAASAFTIAQTAEWQAPAVSTIVAPITARTVTWNAGGLTVNGEIGNFLYDRTMTATSVVTDSLKIIKANTATVITVSLLDTRISNLQNDPDAYTTLPTAADAASIIRPYNVVPFPTADITTGTVCGIALGTVALNHFGMFQIGGLAIVLASGNVTAIAANAPVVPDGVTVGAVKGAAAAAANQVGLSTTAFSTLAGSIPVWLQIGES